MSLTHLAKLLHKQEKAPLRNGDPFPIMFNSTLEERNGRGIVCLISLTCRDCIDLLPILKAFTETYSGWFVLLCNGTAEENDEIKKYFNFSFPVLQMNDDTVRLLGVEFFPYSFLLNNGLIINQRIVHDNRELLELCNKV